MDIPADCCYVSRMPAPPRLVGALLDAPPVRHGFYGRRGGVSTGVFDSLNCGPFSGDRRAAVAANRRRVADDLGVAHIFTNKQVHGNRVRIIEANADPDPGEVFEGDGLVTFDAGVGLGVLAADCAPVLFADLQARVIGAAHGGWKGALLGVTDAVIEKMTQLGARPERMVCAIGPAIQARSYRVGAEFVERLQKDSPFECADCFRRSEVKGGDQTDAGDGVYSFDLPRYLSTRIARAGVAATAINALPDDTFADESRFFSYRRSCHRGEAEYGRQIGVIALV